MIAISFIRVSEYAQHGAGACIKAVRSRLADRWLLPFTAMEAASGSLRFAAAMKLLRLIRMYQQATSALVSMSSASDGSVSTSMPR